MRIAPIGFATSLRDIQRNLLEIGRLQDSVSSGSKINKASDSAAALAISEKLRAQLAGLSQAEENISRGMNVLNTAEGGLSQIGDLLSRGQALALEASGALSPEERQAAQGELDSLVTGIRRIASTTGFAGQDLLNGSQDFTVQDADAAFSQIQISQAPSGSVPGPVTVDVAAAATQGQAGGAIAAVQAGDVQVEIRGALGAVQLTFSDQATRQDIADAINAATDQTGVQADAATGELTATEVGSASFVEVRNLSGALTGVTEGRVSGTDVQATVNGQTAAAEGNTLTVGGGLDARITLAEGTGPGSYGFQIAGGGFRVQAGESAALLGIPSVLPSGLGLSASPAGLESVVTGGANSLANNPEGAAAVFAAALGDLGRVRGQIGAAQSGFLAPLSSSLQVTFENLSATESGIRDTDFAKTLSELASRRIRTQAGLSVLAQSQRLNGEGVLRLLGG